MDASIFDPPAGSLGRSVGRGAVITGLAQGVKLATQILSVVILSRLLAPSDFGVIAMSGAALAFIALFQDFGLTQATVQRRSITHAEVNFLFWVNVAVSVGLACLLVASAPFIALFYGEPRVGPLVAAMSLQIVVYGLGAQHVALLTRRMEFGRLAVIQVASAVVTLLVSIGWTFIDLSYWALFAGALAGAVVPAVCYWAGSKWRPGLPRRADGAGELINFGAGITGFNFANFFARNLDNILIGRYWGEAQLGLYDRAYKLLLFPLSQITNPLSQVMVPALSRMHDDAERYRRAYLRVVPLLLAVALPGVAMATAMADVLIPFVLGQQWHGSSTIFQALGFAGLLQPLNNPAGWLFVSQGRSGDFMRWGIVTAVTSAAAFLVGLPYGALGVAIAYAASEYLRTPFLWMYIGRKGPLTAMDMLRAGGPFVLGGHVALAAVWMAKPMLPDGDIAAALIATLLAYAVAGAVALLFPAGRAALGEALKMLPKGGFPQAQREAK